MSNDMKCLAWLALGFLSLVAACALGLSAIVTSGIPSIAVALLVLTCAMFVIAMACMQRAEVYV